MKIRLGSKVRDTITGFEGIAVARTDWLNGCARIGIQAAELQEGKVMDIEWIDEVQLEGAAAGKRFLPGGPQRDPGGRRDPSR